VNTVLCPTKGIWKAVVQQVKLQLEESSKIWVCKISLLNRKNQLGFAEKVVCEKREQGTGNRVKRQYFVIMFKIMAYFLCIASFPKFFGLDFAY
jgi:hypothetical protein